MRQFATALRALRRAAVFGLAACSLTACVGAPAGYPYQPAVVYARPAPYSIPADVLFAFGSAALRPQAYDALGQTLAAIRQAIPYPAIRVEGNTDSIGSMAYNQQLSLQRAQTVARWLQSQGVPPAAISVVGNGEDRPVAPNVLPGGQDNPRGRGLNRRVDLFANPA